MDNDDLPIGRVHSRREILALFGVSGAALIATSLAVRAATGGADQQASAITEPSGTASTALPSVCIVTPEETEGPYFVDELLYRSDIRTDPSDGAISDGVPLHLTFNIAEHQRHRLHAAGGRDGRYLALRRAGRLLGRAGE